MITVVLEPVAWAMLSRSKKKTRGLGIKMPNKAIHSSSDIWNMLPGARLTTEKHSKKKEKENSSDTSKKNSQKLHS